MYFTIITENATKAIIAHAQLLCWEHWVQLGRVLKIAHAQFL